MPYVLVGEVLTLLRPTLEQFMVQMKNQNAIPDRQKTENQKDKSNKESEE